jgi:putative transposase
MAPAPENLAMQRFQSYKFKLRATPNQALRMRQIAGCCRFVFNRALAVQNRQLEMGSKMMSSDALVSLLAEWRKQRDCLWLADAPFGTQRQALWDLGRAFSRQASGLTQSPKFRKRGRSDSFRCTDPKTFKLDQVNGRIQLPNVGWVPYRKSREISGGIRNVTVSASGGDWFMSLLTERSVARPIAQGPAVGIDMGVVRFATLSDGRVYAPLNSFRRHEEALARAHRSVSRKKIYSNNWNKERTKVQRIYIRIANARRDYLHKISSTISKNHAVVCIEDLRVTAMSKAEAAQSGFVFGSSRAKRGLNKSILDQGWFEFRRQLEYKLRWSGGQLVAVSPRNNSIRCPKCSHVARGNRRSQAEFVCEACGLAENADLIGAVNILRAGHARLACAESSPAYGAMGQEPAEVFSQDQ